MDNKSQTASDLPTENTTTTGSGSTRTKRILRRFLWAVGLVVGINLLLFAALLAPSRPGTLAQAKLSDGRILQVEGVTYGTKHQIGRSVKGFVFDHFGPWIPKKLRPLIEPTKPRSEIRLEEPGLVVWVNAIDPNTGKQVDCQGIRVEFVGPHGDVFGETTRHWYGGEKFWRVGHVFHAFPRTERRLRLRIVPRRSEGDSTVEFENPARAVPAVWSGAPLPQRRQVGKLEILLSRVEVRTNGGLGKRWETPARYWSPTWELRRDGQPASGWDAPTWTAEDPTGNRGQFLGIHQPHLRFEVTVHPSATNQEVAILVKALPKVSIENLATNLLWNMELPFESKPIGVIGLFPAGVHGFHEGAYDPKPEVPLSAVSGPDGPQSGWTGVGKRVSPTKMKFWSGHYSPVPVFYLKQPALTNQSRLAIRLRDDRGRLWITEPEPQGNRDGIIAFLVKVPEDVTAFVPEIVSLPPVRARFDVAMPER